MYDDNFSNLNINDIDYNIENLDYSSQIYELIGHLKIENKIIFYCDENSKKLYLKMCCEIIKFFYRHKTFYEIYCINIYKDGKDLLKSLVRKLEKLKKVENDENDSEDDEENIEYKKACFILIYNCTSQDLIDINIYSILDCNSSFIIIYDKEKKLNNNNKYKGMIFKKIISEENLLLDDSEDYYWRGGIIQSKIEQNKLDNIDQEIKVDNIEYKKDINKSYDENKEMKDSGDKMDNNLSHNEGNNKTDDEENLMDNLDNIIKSNKEFTDEYSKRVSENLDLSLSEIKSIEKWNIIFNKNGTSITVTVEENILFSDLLELYAKELNKPENYINDISVFFNEIEINNYNKSLFDIFGENKNPILEVKGKKSFEKK